MLINEIPDHEKMHYISGLADLLDSNKSIKQWTMNIIAGKSFSMGIKDNEIGGLYHGPALKRGNELSLSIYFKDGRKSSLTFPGDFPALDKSIIRQWKKQSYQEEILPDFPGNPDKFPDPKIFDPAIEKNLENTAQYIKWIKKLRSGATKLARQLDGRTGAGIVYHYVMNSSGFSKGYVNASSSIGIEANSIYGASRASRHLISDKELDEITGDLNKWLPCIEKEIPAGTQMPPDTIVILDPHVFRSLFLFYFMSNLDCGNIDRGQSRFTISDFTDNISVFEKNINIRINSLNDWDTGSVPFSSAGVIGGTKNLVKSGKLNAPVLSLKYAKKYNLNPTPPFGGGKSLEIVMNSGRNLSDYDDFVDKTKNAVIIHEILGLHTQDKVRGDFTLTAPHTIIKINNEYIGKARLHIAGKFFDLLNGDKFGILKQENTPFYGWFGNIPFRFQ